MRADSGLLQRLVVQNQEQRTKCFSRHLPASAALPLPAAAQRESFTFSIGPPTVTDAAAAPSHAWDRPAHRCWEGCLSGAPSIDRDAVGFRSDRRESHGGPV